MNIHLTHSHDGAHDSRFIVNLLTDISRYYPDELKITNYNDADIIIVALASNGEHYGQFNKERAEWIISLNKPIVIFDMSDTSYFASIPSIPNSSRDNSTFTSKSIILEREYDGYLKGYFKAQLLNDNIPQDVSFKIFPLELNTVPDTITHPHLKVSKNEFNNRPIDLFYAGGLLHSPPRLEMKRQLQEHYGLDNIIYDMNTLNSCLNSNLRNLIVYLEFRSEERINLNRILDYCKLSKFSLSQEGAGPKCFRHHEFSRFSILIKEGFPMIWSHPWIHNYNCIEIPYRKTECITNYGLYYTADYPIAIDQISCSLKTEAYEIYSNGLDNAFKYLHPNYYNNHILPSLKSIIEEN